MIHVIISNLSTLHVKLENPGMSGIMSGESRQLYAYNTPPEDVVSDHFLKPCHGLHINGRRGINMDMAFNVEGAMGTITGQSF
jgi:hypothetical protein